jgi:hypothetical protein
VNRGEGLNVDEGPSMAGGQSATSAEASAAPPTHWPDPASMLTPIVGQQAITTSPSDDTIKLALGSCLENQQFVKVNAGPSPPISHLLPTNRQLSTVTTPNVVLQIASSVSDSQKFEQLIFAGP